MSKPYDASPKWLLEINPGAWVRFCGFPVGSARVIDSDISTVTAACDKVTLIEDNPPWLLDVEFLSWADPKAPFTLLFQNVTLTRKHDLPVQSMLVLLSTRARNSRFTGIYSMDCHGRTTIQGFNYTVLDVSRIPVEEILKEDISIVPLALASKYPLRSYREVFQKMQNVILEQAPEEHANELVKAGMVLGGLKIPRQMMEKLMLDVTKLEESSTYQIIHERGENKGKSEGKKEGKKEGKLEEARYFLIRMSRKRLGEPSEAVLKRLEGVTDIEVIHAMGDRLQEVESWDELLPSK